MLDNDIGDLILDTCMGITNAIINLTECVQEIQWIMNNKDYKTKQIETQARLKSF